jgi:hypothetical protein
VSDTESVTDIHVGFAIKHCGGIGPAREEAHRRAVQLLREDEESSPEWAESFMRHARDVIHQGDCPLARTWLRAPITCSACVYDEYMLKAWQQMRNETNPAPDGIPATQEKT